MLGYLVQCDRLGEDSSERNLPLVNGDIPTNCSTCESSLSTYTADTLTFQLNLMIFALLRVGLTLVVKRAKTLPFSRR